jgi:hypothetical protein
LGAGIASLVVASEVVREHEIAAATPDLDAGAEFQGWVQESRMPKALLERPGAAFGEKPLVFNMRAWPNPEIARTGTTLVAE